MLHITEHQRIQTGSSSSRLQFETESFLRYLVLDGKRAYNLGLCCQTCSLLFERLPGADQTLEIDATAEALRGGVGALDEDVVRAIGRGLPLGEYEVLLADATLQQASAGDANDYFSHEQIELWGENHFQGLPHNLHATYYRAGDRDLGQGRTLFNFIVPIFSADSLNQTTAKQYAEALHTKAPGTAVSIAVLEVRSPYTGSPDVNPQGLEHWFLTHYLLDGHHKLHAACDAGKPIQLLSYIALSECMATREQVDEVVAALSAP